MRYHLMSTAELRAVARRDGVKDCDKMSKFELLCTLEDFDNYYGRYCTVTELREDAISRDLSGCSKMRKAELIELFVNVDNYDPNDYFYMRVRGGYSKMSIAQQFNLMMFSSYAGLRYIELVGNAMFNAIMGIDDDDDDDDDIRRFRLKILGGESPYGRRRRFTISDYD